MKPLHLIILNLFLLMFLTGCAAPSNERGVWVGTGKVVNLYELGGKTVPALAIQIDPSQIKKRLTVTSEPILIDKHLMLIAPSPYVGKLLKVKGLIYSEEPINPVDQKKLHANPLGDPHYDVIGVIAINPRSIKILNTQDVNH